MPKERNAKKNTHPFILLIPFEAQQFNEKAILTETWETPSKKKNIAKNPVIYIKTLQNCIFYFKKIW